MPVIVLVAAAGAAACLAAHSPSAKATFVAGQSVGVRVNDPRAKAVMQKMQGVVYSLSPNARYYMDRTSYQLFCDQLANSSANLLEYIAMGGRRVPHFEGLPIRITDALVAETGV